MAVRLAVLDERQAAGTLGGQTRKYETGLDPEQGYSEADRRLRLSAYQAVGNVLARYGVLTGGRVNWRD